MFPGDRDWARLPPELLGSIATRLTVEDYILFRAVCSSWRSAALPSDGFYLPLAPQMPCLLLNEAESCTLVSLHDRRRRRSIAPFPEMRDKWCVGSQDGWLALLDERSEVILFNPISRSKIHLPSVTTMPGVDPIYNSDGSLSKYLYLDLCLSQGNRPPHTYHLDRFRSISFKKVVLSSRPTVGNYTAIAIFGVANMAAFTTASTGKWTLFSPGPSIADIIYHDGKFLALTQLGDLCTLDITGPSPKLTMIASGLDSTSACYNRYLVESSGDLVHVWRVTSCGSDEQGARMVKTTTIHVMKLDPKRDAWVPLKSFGGSSLFLGLCHSISLPPSKIPELKPNCVYFTELFSRGFSLNNKRKLMMRDIGVFNLEDESFERYYPENENRQSNWPPPLWFAPSLL